MSSVTDNGKNRRDSLFDLDDGLEGADDFISEPNPFDDVITNDDTDKKGPPGYGGTADSRSLPPGYEEVAGTSEPVGNGPAIAPPTNTRGALPPGLLNYLSQYFQLNDQEFRNKFYDAVTFRSRSNVEEEGNNSNSATLDLYGPVWITATVIMSNFVGGEFLRLIIRGIIRGVYWSDESDKNFGRLSRSFWLFLAYVFFLPTVIAKMYLHREGSIVELISIYGYSIIVWIPIGFLIDLTNEFSSFLPRYVVSLIKWIFVAFAFGKSSLYLHKKLASGNESDQLIKWPVIGFNAIICIVARFLLYHHTG